MIPDPFKSVFFFNRLFLFFILIELFFVFLLFFLLNYTGIIGIFD